VTVGGVASVFALSNGVLVRRTVSAGTNYSNTGGTPSTKIAVAGATVLVGSSNGIMSGACNGSALTVLWTTAGGVSFAPHWVKNRIIATKGPSLWELTLAGGDLDATTAVYTHPVSDWTWTDVTEAPAAILAGGYSNGQGYIYALRLVEATTAGSTPTLGAAVQVAELPPGEEVHSLRCYLGRYVAIGTNRGVRIGIVDADGTMTYGPLTVTTTNPVRSLAARNNYVYAAVENEIDGSSGAVRIDLAEEIPTESGNASTGRFAWAWDVRTHTTNIPRSIAFLGYTDRVALGLTTDGVYLQSDTNYETTGYVTTGLIRYLTTEQKIFSYLRSQMTLPADSTLTVYTTDEVGNVALNCTLGADSATGDDISINIGAPQRQMAFKLLLTAASGGTATPLIESFQVKAQPNPRVQRVIRIPILMFDFETDSHGVRVGRDGWASERLFSLEALEDRSSVVLLDDMTTGEAFVAKIHAVKFRRVTPRKKGSSGFGGLAEITVVKL
jgi:hypothetical protein